MINVISGLFSNSLENIIVLVLIGVDFLLVKQISRGQNVLAKFGST